MGKIRNRYWGLLILVLLLSSDFAYAQIDGVARQVKDTVPLFKDSLIKKTKALPERMLADVTKQGNMFTRLFGKSHQKGMDSIPRVLPKGFVPDSVGSVADSSMKQLVRSQKQAFVGNFHSVKARMTGIFRKPQKPLSAASSAGDVLPRRLLSGPVFGVGGGYLNYNYNYRSASDTPFAEKNIGQHNVTGSMRAAVARALPFNVNFWIRRSNSIVYRDITDIQVSFDAAAFRNQLVNNLQQRLRLFAPSLEDSLLEKLAGLRSSELLNMGNWLKSPFNIQQLHEYGELIKIDAVHPDNRPSDSLGRQQYDIRINEATAFIQLYDSTREQYGRLSGSVDSLKNILSLQRKRLEGYRKMANGKFSDWNAYSKWKDEMNAAIPGRPVIPEKYKWLMGIRNFSVGKTPLNYSELSAKNITVTGLNFEYNSWYYLAVAGGLIDYRFRDFVVNNVKRAPQYLFMVRAGLGSLQRNYFIVSLLRGQKQLYNLPINGTQSNSISITGITAETRIQLNNRTYVIAEAGESVSPDYRSAPPVETGKFSLNGNKNKALSVRLYTVFPKIGGRAEGMYKYTGANYQSFSSFQTNAALKSWYVKWEQYVFNRKLRITGSLRSNEFTNPYIVQNYKSNTIFKSVNAVFKMRKWPTIAVGYLPMSQLSVVGQQVVESRFQTLTASANHFYRIGSRQANTMLVFNKFYNSNTDSGFIYFNASNFYLSENVVFRLFTAGFGIAESKSSQYTLTAAELTLRIPLFQQTALGMGVKVNNLNKQETRTGGRFAIDLGITKRDRLSVNYERTYLPGTGKQLVKNDMGNIQYSRYF